MRKVRVKLSYEVVTETDYSSNWELQERLSICLPSAIANLLLEDNETDAVGDVEVESA